MYTVTLAVTSASGTGSTTATNAVGNGAVLYAVDYFPGSLDTGATITLTDEYGGASFTLLVKATAGTSNTRYFPRVLKNLNTDGSAITGQYEFPPVFGKPKIAVASAGTGTAGSVVLHLMDL